MEKQQIRINMTLEKEADASLYNYLIHVPPRRRATLLRALASQGIDEKVMQQIVKENGQGSPLSVPHKEAVVSIKRDDYKIDDTKQKALDDAFDDMPN